MPHWLRGWRWRALATVLLLLLIGGLLWPVRPFGAQQIVFNSDRDGDHDIYLLDVATGRTRVLTYNDREDWHPAWSPDGQWIAFTSGVHDTSETPGAWGFYLMDDHGRQVRLLEGDCLAAQCGAAQPRWSPDGRYVAYNWVQGPDWSEIHVADVLTGAVRNLSDRPGWTGPDGQPVWAPDGGSIVLNARPDNQDGLYSLTVPAPDEPVPAARLLASLSASALQWSPDGRLLGFIGRAPGGRGTHVGLLDPASGEWWFITPEAHDSWLQGWWPGGELLHIMHRADDGHTYRHELVTPEGEVARALLPQYHEFRALDWWGGDALAVLTLQLPDADGTYPNRSDLFVANLAGLESGDLRQLTHDAGFNFEATWRP